MDETDFILRLFGILCAVGITSTIACREASPVGPDDGASCVQVHETEQTESFPLVRKVSHKWLRKANYGWFSSWRVVVFSERPVHCSVYIYYLDSEGFLLEWDAEPEDLAEGESAVLGQVLISADSARKVERLAAKVKNCR